MPTIKGWVALVTTCIKATDRPPKQYAFAAYYLSVLCMRAAHVLQQVQFTIKGLLQQYCAAMAWDQTLKDFGIPYDMFWLAGNTT